MFRRRPDTPHPGAFLPQPPADSTTVAAAYIVVLTVTPARLVLQGIPLSISPANLIGLLLLAAWFCAQMTSTLGATKGRNAIRTALFCYCTVIIANFGYAAASHLPTDELRALDRRFVLAFALVGVTLVICDGVRGRDRLYFLVKALVAGVAISAAVGALQFLIDFDLTQHLVLPGLKPSTEDGAVFARADLRRVSGMTANPIEFGLVCASVLPLAVHVAFHAKARGSSSLRWWACAALIASGLMFSVSRSAILGVVVAGVVLMAGWPARRRLQALGAAVAFLAVTKVAVPGLLGVFLGLFANASNDPSIQFRTHDYPIVFAEVAQHPWLGRGLGTWIAPKHEILDNQYLLSVLDIGVVGLAAFCTLFVVAIVSALRGRRRFTDPLDKDLGLSLAAAVTVPMAGAATFDLLSFPTIAGLTFFLIGLTGTYLRQARDAHRAASGGRRPAESGTGIARLIGLVETRIRTMRSTT